MVVEGRWQCYAHNKIFHNESTHLKGALYTESFNGNFILSSILKWTFSVFPLISLPWPLHMVKIGLLSQFIEHFILWTFAHSPVIILHISSSLFQTVRSSFHYKNRVLVFSFPFCTIFYVPLYRGKLLGGWRGGNKDTRRDKWREGNKDEIRLEWNKDTGRND